MGQAKARGTLDQRIVEGLEKALLAEAKRKQEKAALAKKEDEYLASLPPEKRKKRLESRLLMAAVFGMLSEYRDILKPLR